MSDSMAKLLEQILDLPVEDRRLIAEQIQASLEAEDDADTPEERAELARRLQAVADGTAELIDGEQVLADLRQRYQRKPDV